MKKEVLSQFQHTGLPIIGLLIFLIIFFSVVVWVMRKDKKKSFEKASEMPLDDGEVVDKKKNEKERRQ